MNGVGRSGFSTEGCRERVVLLLPVMFPGLVRGLHRDAARHLHLDARELAARPRLTEAVNVGRPSDERDLARDFVGISDLARGASDGARRAASALGASS